MGSKTLNILGINAFHGDSSACILVDGEVVGAVEEERFRRLKHWAGFPTEAIRWCLDEAGLKLADLDTIAINQNASSARMAKVRFAVTHLPSPAMVLDRIAKKRKRASLANLFASEFGSAPRAQIEHVEHHLAHLASAFYVSPFDSAAVVSVDGFGDFSSGQWGIGNGTGIDVRQRTYFPHSLGTFYLTMTQYLGFPNYGDEYKVMGLAPYGKPVFIEQMRDILKVADQGSYALNLKYFRHHREATEFAWEDGLPVFSDHFSDKLIQLLGPRRDRNATLEQHHMDIAASVQLRYEEVFFHLLNQVSESTGESALCLAGGCAMNSVANGKVTLNTPFTKIYVQPAGGDAGGALGAALVAHFRRRPDASRQTMTHAYLGPKPADGEVAAAIRDREQDLVSSRCDVAERETEEILDLVTDAVIDGKVVGWFQGAMEWGPRALGNRSILADPRRTDMKDILNLKIKYRESFRPFAPSILREHVAEWFEQDDDVPFMMKVFTFREDKRTLVPAVCHVNGSGRLQTVTAESNPLYYALIRKFHEKTGVPMLLNTSFNENEPIVCRFSEALDCFLRTNMDLLVAENFVLTRNSD